MLQDSFNGRDPKAASYEGDREQAKKEPLYLPRISFFTFVLKSSRYWYKFVNILTSPKHYQYIL